MRIYGLIGYPLSHSFSVGYFAEKFKIEGIENTIYQNFPIENINLLPDIINNNSNLLGLNVTIPYKTQVIPYLDQLSESASAIGAVNTIKIIRNGRTTILRGYNTDEYGFRNSLLPYLNENHKKALILGTGGASKAVEYVLQQLSISYMLVSRKPTAANQLAYENLNHAVVHEHKLIINTSPLGMYPNIEQYPALPYHALTSNHILYDLIYNPSETAFMKQGISNGATVINGLKMLHLQAEKAWEIWNSI